jgi:hypothetical protein
VNGYDAIMKEPFKKPMSVENMHIGRNPEQMISGFYYDENTPDIAFTSKEVKDRLIDIL